MLAPDQVTAMLRLHALGWSFRRIAQELGCSRETVKRYVDHGGWQPCRQPRRTKALDGLEDWLAERFRRHTANANLIIHDSHPGPV
jgi:transposase